MSKEFNFFGLNGWLHSKNRSIFWAGRRGSHWSERKRFLRVELGGWGYLGFNLTVGGEDREVLVNIGLGGFSLYIALCGVVKSKHKKAETVAKKLGVYQHEVDYSDDGRTTGLMFSLGRELLINFSLWGTGMYWKNRSIKEKFRGFPYCEGLQKVIVFRPLSKLGR